MGDTNLILFFVGFLLFLSVLASSLSRFGPPLLLIFLVVGMLAGQDGPGQIDFDSVPLAFFVANLALAIILLDGGLRTHLDTFRVALRPALSLATVGVVLSAMLVGAFAAWLLDVDWRYGLLLGSIVASTDAAAVFSQLRHGGVALNQRVSATLEIESGTNDPMAIFLVLFLLKLLMGEQELTVGSVVGQFLSQFGIGILGGLVLGYGLSFLLSRLRLVEGLYALLIASGGLMAFTVINEIGGSGFLGIYLVGLIVGNRRNHASDHVFRVMDGLAWLAQAGMFLVLGLLVDPQQLWEYAGYALLIGLFLIVVARPAAVWISLLPFHFPSREQAFVAWVGLRGAVPIVLSLFPLMAGMEGARLLFDITFVVVLMSLIVQGATLAPMARLLRLKVPRRPGPETSFQFEGSRPVDYLILAFRIQPASNLAATAGEALSRFEGVRCIAVTRGARLLFPRKGFVFAGGDLLYLITPGTHTEELGALFRGDTKDVPPPSRLYGKFVLRGDAAMADLAALYNLPLEPLDAEQTLAEFMRRRLRRGPVEGDEMHLGSVRFTVRTMIDGHIDQVGLKLRIGEGKKPGKKALPER